VSHPDITAGTIGYKGSRKSTPFAAQRAAESVANKAKKQAVSGRRMNKAASSEVKPFNLRKVKNARKDNK